MSHQVPDPIDLYYEWLHSNTWIVHGMRACHITALSRELLNGVVAVRDVYGWTGYEHYNNGGSLICVADIVSTVNVDIGRQIIVFDRKPEVRVKWCTRIMTGSANTRGYLYMAGDTAP